MGVELTRYEPLYLKYRPRILTDLVGQTPVVKTLTNAIENHRLSHAYLFTGPRGTGKTSTARILARSLNCEQGPTAQPCLKCTACLEITAGNSPCVLEIDAASNNSVDDARVLIERAPLVALGGRFKFYIIDECHMLTREAFNALLKTIEEPPPNVVFVLATTEEHKVPSTIVSRCQRLIFRLANEDDLVSFVSKIAQVEEIKIENEAIELIARRAQGGLRDALSLLDQASLLSDPKKPLMVNELLMLLGAVPEDTLLSLSKGIIETNGQVVLSIVGQLTMEGREPYVLALELARHFLNLTKAAYLNAHVSGQATATRNVIVGSSAYLSGIVEQAKDLDCSELVQMIDKLNQIADSCRRTTQPALNLEMGLLSLCHRQDIVLLKKLVEQVDDLKHMLSGSGGVSSTASQLKVDSSGAVDFQSNESSAATSNDDISVPKGNIALNTSLATEAKCVEPKQDDELLDEVEKHVCLGEQANESHDLDSFWSKIQDELRQRSPSVGALLSSFPFPLSLSNSEFSIGVPNDMWRNNVEKRLEPIKVACLQVLGYEVSIKVRVVTEKPLARQAKPSQNDGGGGMHTGSSAKDDSEQSTGCDLKSAQGSLNVEPEQKGSLEPASSMVSEAYRLFEGPGSRLIG